MRGPIAYRELSLMLAALSLTGCMAPVGTSGVVSVPPDAAQSCARHCQTIGMRLTAVAIMASNVGCVCQSSNDRSASGVNEGAMESATTTAGMVAVLMEEEQEREQVPPPPIGY